MIEHEREKSVVQRMIVFATTQRQNIAFVFGMFVIIVVAWQLFHTHYPEYDFTDEYAFVGFWRPEQRTTPNSTADVQYLWSSKNSHIRFQTQWSDLIPGNCRNHQITTLLVFAPANSLATMSINGVHVTFDDRPHRIKWVQCQQTSLDISSTTNFVATTDESRPITFALSKASRELRSSVGFWDASILVILCAIGLVGGLIMANLALIHQPQKLQWTLVLTLITIGIWTQFRVVSGEMIYILGGIVFTVYLLRPHIAPRFWRLVFLGLLIGIPLVRIAIMQWQNGYDWDIAIPPYYIQEMPHVYQPYLWWFCLVVTAQLLIWLESSPVIRDGLWWGMVLFIVTGLQSISGFWNATGWSNTLNIAAIHQWSEVWAILTHMRIAIPPILFITEYAIYHSPVLKMLYELCLPRIAIGVCLMLAVRSSVAMPHQRTIRIISSICLCIMVILMKGRLNFFMYDVLTSFFFVMFFQLLVRLQFTPIRAFMLGVVLMCFDMMRPFTMLFVPLFAVLGAYHIYKNHGWQRVLYFFAPLTVLVIWHANHIFVLGQLNWTNHAGFNICHAWPCPDVPLLPEAPPLSHGLWPNINTAIHQINSQRLLNAFFVQLQTNPELIAPTMGRLIQNNLFITRTAEDPIHPIISGIFTSIYFSGMVLQLSIVVSSLRKIRLHSWTQWFRQPKYVSFWYAVSILGMILITTFTETGENYRWIIGFTLILWYLPDDIFVMHQDPLTNPQQA